MGVLLTNIVMDNIAEYLILAQDLIIGNSVCVPTVEFSGLISTVGKV